MLLSRKQRKTDFKYIHQFPSLTFYQNLTSSQWGKGIIQLPELGDLIQSATPVMRSPAWKLTGLPEKHWTSSGESVNCLQGRCLVSGPGYEFPCRGLPTKPAQGVSLVNWKTPHHNSRPRKVSLNGISFLMKMAIICEMEPPVVQLVSAILGAQ